METNIIFELGKGATHVFQLDDYNFELDFDDIFMNEYDLDEHFDDSINVVHDANFDRSSGAFTISYLFELCFRLLSDNKICLREMKCEKQKRITYFDTFKKINSCDIPEKYRQRESFYMPYSVGGDIFMLDIRNKQHIGDYHYLTCDSHHCLTAGENIIEMCECLVDELNDNYDKIRYEDNQGHGIDCFIDNVRIFSTGSICTYDDNDVVSYDYIVFID